MPYSALSIQEFWRRWHMTLSSWLRDYLYIPLGGNRGGTGRTYVNLMITMLLGGLWHGAAWHFVVWGGLHGVYLAIGHWKRRSGNAGCSPSADRPWVSALQVLARSRWSAWPGCSSGRTRSGRRSRCSAGW